MVAPARSAPGMTARREAGPVPALTFAIAGCEAARHAAVPTLSFAVRVGAPDGVAVRSVLLDVQIQIAARRRSYAPEAQARLLELFGPPEGWRTTLRTLPWVRTTAVVPAFTGASVLALPVPCTYDLEVTAARYFAALDGGEIPLELLFSGTVFFTDPGRVPAGLQAARIPWDAEVEYDLPLAVWRQAMERHFPDTAWLRVSTGTLHRLCAYKAAGAFLTVDDALAALLKDAR